jgi:hypothetical protein
LQACRYGWPSSNSKPPHNCTVDQSPRNRTTRTGIFTVDIRNSYQQMCKAMSGGWAAMAAAMGLSKDGLENRVRAQGPAWMSTALQMQVQRHNPVCRSGGR